MGHRSTADISNTMTTQRLSTLRHLTRALLLDPRQPGLLLGLPLEGKDLVPGVADFPPGDVEGTVRLALGLLGAHDALAGGQDARVRGVAVVAAGQQGGAAARRAGRRRGCAHAADAVGVDGTPAPVEEPAPLTARRAAIVRGHGSWGGG